MKNKLQAYTKGIEKKLIEEICGAKSSLKIAVAWFTNNKIKDSLIQLKKDNPEIEISIVVDDNEINKKYFFNYKTKFEGVGIKLKDKASKRFLHHKFTVIDESTTITGSYNYSKKANSNLENIVVVRSKDFSLYYSRIFDFLTTKEYIDENIKLLFDNLNFAQSILSTYYPFSKKEYKKYINKIEIGDCFTHENGLCDEIKYYPGLIFNEKIKYKKFGEFDTPEFRLPVDKEMIKSWVKNRNMNLILDWYNGQEDKYHLINDDLEQNEKAVEKAFERKMEKTYRSEELKRLIEEGVDIIVEDDLWLNNFEPFISKKIVEQLFDEIEEIEKKTGGNNM